MSPKNFMALLEKKKFIYKITDSRLAQTVGVSERTFKRRKLNPGEFTFDEAEIIMKVLHFTPEERKEALL